MKKILSLLSIVMIITASMFALTGCGNKGEKKGEDNNVEISTTYGKGTIKFLVPKKEDGLAKYEITSERPEGLLKSLSGTYYLETDKAIITLAGKGFTYQTGKDYKAKYGDVKGSFQGYLDFMNDPSSTIPKNNVEILEINGKKAVKRESKLGSAGDYKYYGFYYMIEADDVTPGSYIELGVFYKGEEEHKSADPIDEETQAIINSYSMTLNK